MDAHLDGKRDWPVASWKPIGKEAVVFKINI
jgi:hypothetical protein